jgi:hypothetical protein
MLYPSEFEFHCYPVSFFLHFFLCTRYQSFLRSGSQSFPDGEREREREREEREKERQREAQ